MGDDWNQQHFLANVDVAVAEAVMHHADKGSTKEYQTQLLDATAKFHYRLKDISKEVSCDMLLRKEAVAGGNEGTDERMRWIVLKAPKEAAPTAAPIDAVAAIKPNVLQSDELGVPITAHDEVSVTKDDTKQAPLPLP